MIPSIPLYFDLSHNTHCSFKIFARASGWKKTSNYVSKNNVSHLLRKPRVCECG